MPALRRGRDIGARAKALVEVQERAAPVVRQAASQPYISSDARLTKEAQDADPRYGLTPEQIAQYDKNEAANERYGSDLSWLDPSFQEDPAVLGQSAGSDAQADPAAIAQQSGAMDRARALANENLNFSDPALQQSLGSEWARIQGGAGAPQFGGDADQRRVLEQALGFSSNQGPGSLTFDDGARQREQYGNLQGIVAGGGATAIEMADRARQRGDSEAWLRGQREADMANYAERGLTGSGMELLNLSADRQAAAQRNSLGDLETAKALEERRLGAINSAAGLAGTMRGQTIDEQSLLNQRTTTGLGAASSVANAMRGADFDEKTYLDKRGIDALQSRTDLQNMMRDQQYNEQIGNRNAQQSALNTWSDTAGQARGQSASESQYRAGAADDFAARNQAAINNASSANKSFLQNSYQQMMANRQAWESQMASLGANVAQGLMGSDQQENMAGFQQGTTVGSDTADQFNTGKSNFNSTLTGTGQQANQNTLAAEQKSNTIYPQLGKVGAGYLNTVVGGAMNEGSLGSSGSPVAGAPLSQQGTTWASDKSSGIVYDPDKIRNAMGY